jgi:hypothetical protein
MESVFNILKTSSIGLEKAFANVISKADGMGLTFEDLSKFKEFEDKDFEEVYDDKNGFAGDLHELYA